MDFDIFLILHTFNLKEVKEHKYTLEDWDETLVYVFDNYVLFKKYFKDNGVSKIDDKIINMCIFKITRKDKIIAFKGLCDHLITKYTPLRNYSFKEIEEIHERGNLTPWEKVEEWEANDLCAPADSARCHVFDNCHECLVNYALKNYEWEPINFKLVNKPFSKELRKRDI